MATKDILMALAPSLVGNGAALALGVAHGSSGDMPRIGAKKDEKGNPILDKDGNQQGGVPWDAATAGIGYAGAAAFALLAKGNTRDVGMNVMLRVGDAGSYIYTYSWGGQMGQKSRKDAGKLTGQANARTVTSGEAQNVRQMPEQRTVSPAASDPAAELSRLYGISRAA